MNVRLTPRDAPRRTDLYGGIVRVYSDGTTLWLAKSTAEGRPRWMVTSVPLVAVAELALDEDGGDLF